MTKFSKAEIDNVKLSYEEMQQIEKVSSKFGISKAELIKSKKFEKLRKQKPLPSIKKWHE